MANKSRKIRDILSYLQEEVPDTAAPEVQSVDEEEEELPPLPVRKKRRPPVY